MSAPDNETCPLATEKDIVTARQRVRQAAQELGFSIVDQTKVVTAASELARNTLIHGNGGTMSLSVLNETSRVGLRLVFDDSGNGIANVDLALSDGWTSGNGLGLGLSGAKRLSSEFTLETTPGAGTRVTIVRWATRRL